MVFVAVLGVGEQERREVHTKKRWGEFADVQHGRYLLYIYKGDREILVREAFFENSRDAGIWTQFEENGSGQIFAQERYEDGEVVEVRESPPWW